VNARQDSIAADEVIEARLGMTDLTNAMEELDVRGCTMREALLSPAGRRSLPPFCDDDTLFRRRVVMGQHGFGRSEHQYFRYPLPSRVAALYSSIHLRPAPLAKRWNATMRIDVVYPDTHAAFIRRCRDPGPSYPAPLLLQYGVHDYHCLHQDLYGEPPFPLQVDILLSGPERDFCGGELVLTEKRPRMQSCPEVVPLRQADAVIFAVRQRPVNGTRGSYRVNLRHGGRVRRGHRHTLGIICHDAP
jgi:hypothetical protein